MQRRSFLATVPAVPATAVLAVAGTGCGGSAAAGTAATAGKSSGAPSATIELEKGGSFTIQLFPQDAPKTVENFVQKAQAGYYNGLTFHRVEDWVVQGGDPSGNGTGGRSIPSEIGGTQKPFTLGSVGIARGPDIKINNDSQFFIVKQPAPAQLGGKWSQLDGQYTNFGQVTDGMPVVQGIKIGDKIKRVTVKS